MTDAGRPRDRDPRGELHRVLIVGGGVAAIEAILALRDLAGARIVIELVSAARELTYRPLAVGEPFGIARATSFDIAEITTGYVTDVHFDTCVSVADDGRSVKTDSGNEIRCDSLLLACGARLHKGIAGAVHFMGPGSATEIKRLLNEIEAGEVRRILFAVPEGVSWALPLYELALLTRAWLRERGARDGVELAIATPEDSPLATLGSNVSETVERLLRDHGIELHPHTIVRSAGGEGIKTAVGAELEADRVVTLPVAYGPRIEGLPSDAEGFLPVDDHCAVRGYDGVYAAGDVTDFPVKHGGIATQQADAAAEAIAARAGAALEPTPFDPVFRGVLLTGERSEFLRAALRDSRAEMSEAEADPLWWPPAKIAGKYLGPYLNSIVAHTRS